MNYTATIKEIRSEIQIIIAQGKVREVPPLIVPSSIKERGIHIIRPPILSIARD
jgi:hypothetical protein